MKSRAAASRHRGAEKKNDRGDFFETRPAFNAKALAVAVFAALVAALIPALYWLSRNQLVNQDLRSAITLESSHIKYLLENQFNSFELIARSVKGFIDGSENVTSDEFKIFVTSLNLHSISPGLQGVGFARLVTGKNAEARAKALLRSEQGSNSYQIKPLGSRAVYAPIIFMEPREGNEKTIGFDIFSVEEARNSAKLAGETGDLIASQKLTLVQDAPGKNVAGFVLYLAIYMPGRMDIGSEEMVRGWVDLPFRLVDVFQPIAKNLAPGLELAFYEKEAFDDAAIAHRFLNGAMLEGRHLEETRFSRADYVDFGGRKWYFRITPTQAYVARNQTSTHHWIASTGILLSFSLGVILFLLLTSRERAKALAVEMTANLRGITADLNDTLDAIPDLLFEMDLDARYLAVRTSNQASLNMPVDDVLDKTVWDVLPPKAAKMLYDSIREAHLMGRSTGNRIKIDVGGDTRCFELSVARKQRVAGMPPNFIVLSRDITERTRAEQQVHQLAYFDVLTGLPNRGNFLEVAPRLIEQCSALDGFGAVLMIDIDNLKLINDHWGHQCGDEVLKHVASRTSQAIGPQHMVARFGGDELVVVLNRLGTDFELARNAAERICQRILREISAPMSFASREHYVSASIGVAFFDASKKSMDEIVSGADSAMFHAKNDGRNTYKFFDRQLQKVIAERVGLEHDMRVGLYSDEFYLVYQPQVDMHGRVTGAEALCRWRHPEKGLIPPSVFIDIAEKSGFIFQLGQWVLQRTCETLHAWSKDAKLSQLRLAANVSAKQFHHPDFLAQTIAIIESSHINPFMLELEITESIFAQDADEIAEKMGALKSMGVYFSLDDFGTGYSSLNYLKRLPLDQLKIDQSFIRDVVTSTFDASIVATIISLGESLGLQVLAEGIETSAQHESLLAKRCRHFQGYLFAKPLSEADFLDYVQRESSPVPDGE
ncbi:EAL domain-containing protein [Pantoea sp. 18069]|uniref:bifunctional diguanylate cyclase/phosphodiesterase n=1 Tax=Pantoea sp. 18069 TaxID=2681415 RepID=UPI00135970FF|nr:EAL domain-containing protein [Pantoea sp. 18069]